MATHYWKNKDVNTDKIFSKLTANFFPDLRKAKFLLTFRDNTKMDDEGNTIVAEARKCGTKERDLWGFDFEICMDSDIWNKANKADKYRIGYHELCHCGVEKEDGSNEVKYDDNNQLKTFLIKHDLFLKTFKQEIEIFGFEGVDNDTAEFMSEMLESRDKIKKNKKAFLGALGIEINKSVGESVLKKKKKPVEDTDEDEDIDDLDDTPVKKKKKKKKVTTEITVSTKKKKKPSAEELEEQADKLLGLKKKKKDKFVEIDMKEYNRKKFGGKKIKG
jgi:hypothetical protein